MGEIVKKLAAKSQNTLTDLATTKSRIGYTPLLLAGKIMAEDSADVTLSQLGAQLLDSLVVHGKCDPSAVVSKPKFPKANQQFEEGRSAAHYLATGSNLSILKALLEHKPRLDCLDKNGLSPLTAALDANQHASAIALLEGGARVEFCAPNNDKQFILAPLVFACKRHGSKDATGKSINLMPAIKAMLEKIDDLNSVNPCPNTKMTPLMFACQGAQDAALVKCLLLNRADVHAKDSNEKTALHHAVLNTEPNAQVSQVVELLLNGGANVTG